jgi:hypothetical protein
MVILFAHVAPFVTATKRHLMWTNFRQEKLMRLAEQLTDPRRDPVFDAVNSMVPTRPVVDLHAVIHGQVLPRMVRGGGPQIRDYLAANPPAVIMQSYRTEWLPEADQEFIRTHYVEVSDDFLVPGKILPSGGGTVTILKEGRYRISTLEDSDLLGTYPEGLAGLMERGDLPAAAGTLNGQCIPDRPIELDRGTYELKTASDSKLAVVWVGPYLQRIGRHGTGDRSKLFHNWY